MRSDPSLPKRLARFGEVTEDAARLAEADVALVRSKTKCTAEWIAQAPKLKLIIRGGVGIDITGTNGGIAVAAEVSCNLCGDANGDGCVNVIDALVIANYTAVPRPDLAFPTHADVNRNGMVEIVDAIFIAQRTVELRPSLSCPAL